MAKGPKDEYRPADPISGGVLVMRIAVGELSEADARDMGKKPKRAGRLKSKGATKGSI